MHIPYSIKTYLPIILLIAGSFWFTAQYIEPPPPKTLTIAAGAKTGSYYQNALKYKAYLEEQKMEVTILETKGSVENIEMLENGSADIAFVQSGLSAYQEEESKLQSLSSLFYEPVWIFHRSNSKLKTFQDFKGKTISVGSEGSGTRKLAQQILSLHGISDNNSTLTYLSGERAFTALQNKQSDISIFVSNIDSAFIGKALRTEGISVFSIKQNIAYERNYEFVSALTLPEGVIDIQNNIPPQDIHLISPVSMLTTTKDFHPALKSLIVHATYEIYADHQNLYKDNASFPTIKYADIPVSKQAERYYENGPSILNKYLPFWVADMISRLKILVIPLITVMLPLMKIAPPAYRWSIRSKIYKWYKQLKKMENSVVSSDQKSDITEALHMLDEMDQEAKKTPVPLSYTDSLYNLRMHISLIRSKLLDMKK